MFSILYMTNKISNIRMNSYPYYKIININENIVLFEYSSRKELFKKLDEWISAHKEEYKRCQYIELEYINEICANLLMIHNYGNKIFVKPPRNLLNNINI